MTEITRNIKSISLSEKWITTKLKDISGKITKGSTPTSYGYSYKTEGIKFVKTENIDENSNVFSTTNFINEETNEFLKRSILYENDLLFSIAGTIGRIALIKKKDLPANTNQALAIIRLLPGAISHKYLLYYLKSDSIQKKALKKIVGVGRANLSLKNIGEFEVPIVPKNEQNRIVEEIEKQFSRLDDAVENLKRVKVNLKRYKASVLKAAVEGKLTEEWRKKHPDIEPADKLLDRILRKNNKSQAELPDFPIDVLPESWCVATMDQLTDYVTSGSRGWAKYYSNSGDLFIRAQNLKNDKIEFDDVAYVQLPQRVEGKRTLIQRNDILITITGANVTKAGILDCELDRKAYVNQHIALTRPAIPEISKYLFFWIICSTYGRRELEKAAYGAGKPGLNLTNIRELSVALPPLEEQEEIIEEIGRLLSLSNELEKTVDKALRCADRLRQSILKKAFSGKLIPSADEYEQEISHEMLMAAEGVVSYGTET